MLRYAMLIVKIIGIIYGPLKNTVNAKVHLSLILCKYEKPEGHSCVADWGNISTKQKSLSFAEIIAGLVKCLRHTVAFVPEEKI